MKKLAMFVVLSMLCCFYAATSLAAQTNYWKFHIVADERVDGNSEPVPKNDSEQICHVTPTSGVSDSKGFYVRSRTYVGDHEASQAMKIAVNNHHYKLKYSVRKGVAGTLYNLRGQANHLQWTLESVKHISICHEKYMPLVAYLL